MERRPTESARFRGGIPVRPFAFFVSVFAAAFVAAVSFASFSGTVLGQTATECSDGIDNDGDGTVDALVNGGNPTATLSIGGGNPFAIRAIVNTGGFGIPDNGAIHRDPTTVHKVCQIQGYSMASGSDCTAPPYENRCGWRSFSDNLMFAWNGSSFYSIRDNVWTSSITCVGIPAACGDGKDNDGDGKIDVADPGCSSATDSSEVSHDSGCMNAADPFEGARKCSDGIDNDGDGKADFAGGDPGCADANDDDEADPQPDPPANPDPPADPDVDPDPDTPGDTCALEFSSCGQSPQFFGTAASCREGRCVFADGTISRETCTCSSTPVQCTVGFHCFTGTLNGNLCNPGKTTEFEPGGTACTNYFPDGRPPQTGGVCYRCVDDDGNVDDDPPPMCPVGCAVDADCGGQSECSPDLNDPTKPLCWKDEDGLCVKKCKVPRCIDNKCTIAPPAEGTPGHPYVQCAGVTDCPAPRCGDGVVQASEQAQDPGPDPDPDPNPDTGSTCNVTGTSCEGMADARACKEPYCVDVNGREIQGTSCTCPAQQAGNECSQDYPVCPFWGMQAHMYCPPEHTLQAGNGFTCTAGDGFTVQCAKCAPLDCSNGYRSVQGALTQTRPSCSGGWFIQALNSTCNCIMASLNEPSARLALTAQVIDPVETGEECDDGNADAGDGCSPTCKKELCGDGVVQPKGADGLPNTADDEKCDDGNRAVGDGCNNECVAETCGNGVHDQGEECDDGADNSDTEPGACRTDCTRPACDDGVIDDVAPYGEQCECLGVDGAETVTNENGTSWLQCEVEVNGFPALCSQCRANYCGDGFQFNPGIDNTSGTADDEMCDAGPFNTDFPVGSGECTTNAQCPGAVCVDGECAQVTCSEDSECHGGKCVRSICMPGGCANDEDCGEDGQCFEGQCRRGGSGYGYNTGGCTENTDCPSGYCYPNGSCMPEIKGDLPEPYCRMDCKPIRCGDGVVDTGAGETCDEGEKMFKCNGFPQPACDCAIPSWGSHLPGVGPYDTTCCPENQYCSVWPTDTCPVDCGVGTGGRGGVCGNHRLDIMEECDVSVAGWQGPDSDWADAQVTYAYRPNRDGTDTSFLAVDGNWLVLPAAVDDQYTVVDHEPRLTQTDNAWMYSARQGAAKTYFHLWDIPLTTETLFTQVEVVASVDFSELEPEVGWTLLRLPLQIINNAINGADMNAAVLEIVADEDEHTLTFTLHHSVTRLPLTRPGVMRSPTPVSGTSTIAIDAVQIETFGTSFDASYSCNVDLCTLIRCGNRIEDPGETCDDGNNASGDGCSESCAEEICRVPGI